MNKQFYVYKWYNIDTGEIFYIGKGSKDRFKITHNRNKLFLDYIKHHNCTSEIIEYFDNEEDAFKREEELIKYYKSKNLAACNIACGGYGGFSIIWDDNMKSYWSEHNPMKNEKQRQRMREHNPMKNKETAKKNSMAHKRAVIINGIEFDGVIDAAEYFKVCGNTISAWCQRGHDNHWNPCRYKDEPQKEYKKIITSARPVYLNDLYFPSVKAASQYLGEKDSSPLCKALKQNKKYKGYDCRYANQQPS